MPGRRNSTQSHTSIISESRMVNGPFGALVPSSSRAFLDESNASKVFPPAARVVQVRNRGGWDKIVVHVWRFRASWDLGGFAYVFKAWADSRLPAQRQTLSILQGASSPKQLNFCTQEAVCERSDSHVLLDPYAGGINFNRLPRWKLEPPNWTPLLLLTA